MPCPCREKPAVHAANPAAARSVSSFAELLRRFCPSTHALDPRAGRPRSLDHLEPAPLHLPAVARIVQRALARLARVSALQGAHAREALAVDEVLQDERVLLVREAHPRERVDLPVVVLAPQREPDRELLLLLHRVRLDRERIVERRVRKRGYPNGAWDAGERLDDFEVREVFLEDIPEAVLGERLGEVVVHTRVVVLHDLRWFGVGRHGDDRRHVVELTDERRRGNTIQLRHHDVLETRKRMRALARAAWRKLESQRYVP